MPFEWMKDVQSLMDQYRADMLESERAIWAHPQTGFKEWFANDYLKERFLKMGFALTEAGNIPGFYFDIDTGREGPTVCVMGELDSVRCPEHPEADPETGAVHACGHNCQSSALLGIAGALKDPKLLSKLSGKIRIMAVPAEELLELGYRAKLREQGTIRYMGGKVEFISRGYFEGVDMSILIHTTTGNHEKPGLYLYKGDNGCIVKNITFTGKASHAGGAPEYGINALYAAEVAFAGANALRETFADEDHVRFHPIITSGGAIVNAIPAKVTAESYVRASTFEALKAANRKVNRALAAGALALGAQVEINDKPGYMPLYDDKNLNELFREVGTALFGAENVEFTDEWSCGSTDVGDVSCIMPAVQPCCFGAVGAGHGADYYITNPEAAVVQSAAVQVCAVCALLENGAERAKQVKAASKPLFASSAEFLAAIDKVSLEGDAIAYDGANTASIRWAND